MRQNIINIILIVFILIGNFSCSKWLDVQPSNQTSSDKLFKTEEGFQEALSGVYTLMTSPTLYGKELTFGFSDIIAQQWELSGINQLSNPTYFGAKEYDFKSQQTYLLIENIWKHQYEAIANINNIIGYIDKKKNVFESDLSYSLIKGEALGIRAFLHFDILRLFAPNDFVLGTKTKYIPYVNELSKNMTLSMGADEIVNECIKDLNRAIKLMKNDPIVTEKQMKDTYFKNRTLHMNYYAMEALLARIYIYKGDKTNALKYAKNVINAQTANRFRWVNIDEATASAEDKRDLSFSSEHIFSLNINKLGDYTKTHFGTTGANAFVNRKYNASTDILFQEEPNDYRAKQYINWNGVEKQFGKFKQVGMGVKLMPLIKISEMYYIVAECSNDINEAIGAITEILKHRGINKNISAASLQEEINKEYHKEFTGEGQLVYFYKRLNIKIDGVGDNYKTILPLPKVEIDLGGRIDN